MFEEYSVTQLKKELIKYNLKSSGIKKDLFDRLNKYIEENKFYLFIDIETNGLPQCKSFGNYYDPSNLEYYDTSRIIEIAYIITDDKGNIVKEVCHLIKPQNFKINNSHIHGITFEKAKNEGVNLEDVINELKGNLFNINKIISHNINFDINVLLSECYRLNSEEVINKVNSITKDCTMKYGQEYMNVKKYPKLIELYKFLFNEEIIQDHRALADTILCKDCFFKMHNFK